MLYVYENNEKQMYIWWLLSIIWLTLAIYMIETCICNDIYNIALYLTDSYLNM